MEFQKCSIHGVAYGEGVTEAQRGAATREGKADTLDPHELNAKLATLKQQMMNVMERAVQEPLYAAGQAHARVAEVRRGPHRPRGRAARAHRTRSSVRLHCAHSVLADKPGTADRAVLD